MNEIIDSSGRELVKSQTQQNEQILKSDIQLPWVLLQQGLSDFVSEGKAQMGDMVNSMTGEKLGDKSKPIEFIPLTMKNSWVLSEKIGNKYEYRKTLPRDSGLRDGKDPLEMTGESLPWDFVHNGLPWKRTKVITVYAVLVKDIVGFLEEVKKAQETGDFDLDKALMPYAIGFRSTSYNAGKKVSTQFAKAQAMAAYGAKPYTNTMMLGCHMQKNDQGTFYVYDVTPGRKCTKDEIEQAASLYKVVTSGNVKTHDIDTGAPEESASLSDEY